jgi:hypothetical protein
MAYTPGPFGDSMHLYLQWGGKLPGNESWSCGLRMIKKGAGPWTSNDPAAMLAAVTTAVGAYHSRAGTSISPSAKLSFVKLNAIAADGHYIDETTREQVVGDTPGGGTDRYFPNQVALAVTLETGFSRGSAHRGRFYLPLPAIPVATTGLIDIGDAVGVRTSTETFRVALNAVAANWQVGVMSRKLGAPAQRPVTSIHVGRVLDTQRRRRRSLAEDYQ